VGSTKLYCTLNGLTKKVHFEIVEHASTSLLSGRASEALQLIHFNQEYLMQVNTSSDPPPLNKEQVLHKYHDVFSGLGKLPGTYHIDMDPNAKAVQGNPLKCTTFAYPHGRRILFCSDHFGFISYPCKLFLHWSGQKSTQ